MALPAFDTHAYVKRLKAAGFNEAQAEAQAELQAEILSSLVTEKLATKEDLKRLESVTKEEIANLAKATKEDIANLARETKEDIATLAKTTKEDMSHLEHEFIRLEGKVNQLNWMLGFLLLGVVSIVFKLFLHT